VSGTTRTPLDAGREAISRYEWREGFELLSEADASEGLAPEDLERMAEAAWWTARLEECIAARERAFAAYMDAGNVRRAAIVAIALVKDYYAKGSSSIGSAWVKRAERLLADTPVCVEQGWLHRIQGVIALEGRGDYDAALHEARRSHELAARFADADLAAVSLHDEGRALVMQGDVAGGMALIDEATAPAISGELTPYTTGVIYCNTITACKDLADYRRAGDWTEAAKRWCDRQAIAGFPGMCRVYRASIMMVRGAWAEAEVEARRACEELGAFNLSYAAEAFYELGEIRMRAGDHGAAEEAFKQAHELGREPQPGLALLRLAQGRVDSASSCIEEALEHESGDLHRSRLLPAQVAVALAADDRATARTATEELEAIATRFGSDALKAAAAATRAQLALAENDTRAASRAARHALRLWQAIDAPYEAANARLLLGEAYLVRGDDEDAALEFEAARSVFERLGAALDVRRAREQLDGARRAAGRGSGGPAKRTFMFTDVVRSTDLVAAIGDDAWTDVVGWHDRTLRTLFDEHGGEEIDHAGDGFFVAFEDPRRAVESAVAIQRRLAEHRREHGFAPQVRIGLHASEAARDRGTYRGRGVHEAARISALAGADEIVASTDTVRANPPRFPVSTPRTVELKGIPAPVEVVSVDWR
jgi:class 3 adenylate cyclase